MDQHISPYFVTGSNSGKDGKIISLEIVIKVINHVIPVAKITNVKAFDFHFSGKRLGILRINDDPASSANYPDTGIHVIAQCFNMIMKFRKLHVSIIVVGRIIRCDFRTFGVQVVGFFALYLIFQSPVSQGGYQYKPQNSEYEVACQKLQV